MANYFLTKVWGFSPETYPVIGFNRDGARHKFLKESKPGDWIILAGTKNEPTNPKDQGRLLGKVQLGTDQIDVVKILRTIGTDIPSEHYNEDGHYKWPYGLPILKAFRFIDSPDLSDLFGSYLSGTQWASYALNIEEKLGRGVISKVKDLDVEEASIIDVPIISNQRERHNALVLNKKNSGVTGPGPSDFRSGSVSKHSSAEAYVFQLVYKSEPENIFKVGYSADVAERLSILNKGLVSIVTKYQWKIELTQAFTTCDQAYSFEQIVHSRLQNYRVDGEQEIFAIEPKILNSVWSDVFYGMKWNE